jgi:hypothetical protein
MSTHSLTSPASLERNAFLWSEVRLVVAALALFLGGVPPITLVFGGSSAYGLLKLAWLISGVASAYLGYRWYQSDWRVTGRKDRADQVAMGVSVISGINLGLVGLLGTNLGMSIASGQVIFVIVGAGYLWSAWQLWTRWKAAGEHLF